MFKVTDNDILQKIPDHLLPNLRDLFKAKWPSASLPYFCTDMIIQWKNKGCSKNVHFYAPNGIWQDGTFVAVINVSYIINISINHLGLRFGL